MYRSGDIYVMDSDGGEVRRVTSDAAPEFGAAWSPDGSTLVFVSSHQEGSHNNTILVDGTGVRRITSDLQCKGGLDWSPDGTRIAFHREQSGQYDIYVVNVRTLVETRLTSDPGIDAQPSWSPSGASIAFASTRAGPFDWAIYTMDASGGNVTRVTTDTFVVAAPDWSPDGAELVIEQYPNPPGYRGDIYRVRLDGSGSTVVTHDVEDDRAPSWGFLNEPVDNLGVTAVRVLLTYTERGSKTPLPPSATGATYWVEGALRGRTTASVYLGRIEDEKTVYAIPLGSYDVTVGYGPSAGTTSEGSLRNYPLQLPSPVSVTVRANETTPVTVELGQVLGVIAGAVTLNQAPPGDGFVLCTYASLTTDRWRLLWCTPLAGDGGFRQLLPAGAGCGLVCFAAAVDATLGCPDPAIRRTTATLWSGAWPGYGCEGSGDTITLRGPAAAR